MFRFIYRLLSSFSQSRFRASTSLRLYWWQRNGHHRVHMSQLDKLSLHTYTTVRSQRYPLRALAFTGLTTILLSSLAVGPAAAQVLLQSSVCDAQNLPGMIEGFFQITTSLGIIGLAVVWQADSLVDMFTLDPEQKRGLKRHKQSAMKSAVILVILGPLYTVAGPIMGLPLAECVNLAPW